MRGEIGRGAMAIEDEKICSRGHATTEEEVHGFYWFDGVGRALGLWYCWNDKGMRLVGDIDIN